ncbi:restriction endonuclease-like protein [Paenibacillus periandrae]|uniref:restriction endonuclease-like protein n=1 Tax=Paenibacillus periandrae TaxID=1761741 RepID=UPI00308414D9
MMTDSLHFGSLKKSVILLHIETNLFDLYLEGKPYHPTVDMLRLHRTEERVWEQADLHVSIYSDQLQVLSIAVFNPNRGELEPWQNEQACFPIFYETQTYNLLVEKKADIDLSFYHENYSLREAVLPKGKRVLSGNLNFQNEIGFSELELRSSTSSLLRIRLEVFPVKMDYKRDYQVILQDVNHQIHNLIFDFLRKTYQLTGLKETKQQSLTEYFTILRYLFDQLIKAVQRIGGSPHTQMHQSQRIVPAERAKKINIKTLQYLSKHPQQLVKDPTNGMVRVRGERYVPTHVLDTRRVVNYDTQENRFVRWVFLRIERKLKDLWQLLKDQKRLEDPMLAQTMTRMQKEVRRVLQFDFLQVGTMKQMSVSLVMQMAPGYREVYKYYLMLLKGLTIQDDLFRLSLKDLATLYEYWCFLKIHQLLSNKYELVRQDIIKLDYSGVFVKLKKSAASTVTYRNPKNGEIFKLFYNQALRGPTLTQKPDNVLTLRKMETSTEYKYVFDAKYRLNPAEPGTPYYATYDGLPGPEEGDINTMHRYRDAIVHAEKDSEQFERTMFGAYVLFPYPDEKKYREHRFYKSIKVVNVGAFPFLPGSTKLLEEFLDEIILDSPENAYERAIRPKGSKEYYDNKYSGKNVLVGCMSREEQLEVALKYNFYHTPLENITNHKILTQLEYVALYQSKKFFGKTNEIVGVRYYGRIRDWKIVKRGEITVIPSKHNPLDKLYVVFEIEEWETREEIILPGGHGVRSIAFTSKYIFDRAQEIAELKLENEEELLLWREARRRGRVEVKLDHEHLDYAKKVMSVSLKRQQ